MKKTLIALVAATAALAMTACGDSGDEYIESYEDDTTSSQYDESLSEEPSDDVTLDDGTTLTSEDYTQKVLQTTWDYEITSDDQVEMCDAYLTDTAGTVQEVMNVDEDFDRQTVVNFFDIYC